MKNIGLFTPILFAAAMVHAATKKYTDVGINLPALMYQQDNQVGRH